MSKRQKMAPVQMVLLQLGPNLALPLKLCWSGDNEHARSPRHVHALSCAHPELLSNPNLREALVKVPRERRWCWDCVMQHNERALSSPSTPDSLAFYQVYRLNDNNFGELPLECILLIYQHLLRERDPPLIYGNCSDNH